MDTNNDENIIIRGINKAEKLIYSYYIDLYVSMQRNKGSVIGSILLRIIETVQIILSMTIYDMYSTRDSYFYSIISLLSNSNNKISITLLCFTFVNVILSLVSFVLYKIKYKKVVLILNSFLIHSIYLDKILAIPIFTNTLNFIIHNSSNHERIQANLSILSIILLICYLLQLLMNSIFLVLPIYNNNTYSNEFTKLKPIVYTLLKLFISFCLVLDNNLIGRIEAKIVVQFIFTTFLVIYSYLNIGYKNYTVFYFDVLCISSIFWFSLVALFFFFLEITNNAMLIIMNIIISLIIGHMFIIMINRKMKFIFTSKNNDISESYYLTKMINLVRYVDTFKNYSIIHEEMYLFFINEIENNKEHSVCSCSHYFNFVKQGYIILKNSIDLENSSFIVTEKEYLIGKNKMKIESASNPSKTQVEEVNLNYSVESSEIIEEEEIKILDTKTALKTILEENIENHHSNSNSKSQSQSKTLIKSNHYHNLFNYIKTSKKNLANSKNNNFKRFNKLLTEERNKIEGSILLHESYLKSIFKIDVITNNVILIYSLGKIISCLCSKYSDQFPKNYLFRLLYSLSELKITGNFQRAWYEINQIPIDSYFRNHSISYTTLLNKTIMEERIKTLINKDNHILIDTKNFFKYNQIIESIDLIRNDITTLLKSIYLKLYYKANQTFHKLLDLSYEVNYKVEELSKLLTNVYIDYQSKSYSLYNDIKFLSQKVIFNEKLIISILKIKFQIDNQIIKSNNVEYYDKSGIVIISNEYSKLGNIINTNHIFCNLLNFDKKDLIGKSINVVLPEYLTLYHDMFIERFINTNIPSILNKNNIFFYKSSKGFICPCHSTIKVLPHIIHGIKFISAVNRLNTESLVQPDIKTIIVQDKSETSFKSNMSIGKLSLILTTDDPNYFLIGVDEISITEFGIPYTSVFSCNMNLGNLLSIKDILVELDFNKLDNLIISNPLDIKYTEGEITTMDTSILQDQLNDYLETSKNTSINITTIVNRKHLVHVSIMKLRYNKGMSVINIFRIIKLDEYDISNLQSIGISDTKLTKYKNSFTNENKYLKETPIKVISINNEDSYFNKQQQTTPPNIKHQKSINSKDLIDKILTNENVEYINKLKIFQKYSSNKLTQLRRSYSILIIGLIVLYTLQFIMNIIFIHEEASFNHFKGTNILQEYYYSHFLSSIYNINSNISSDVLIEMNKTKDYSSYYSLINNEMLNFTSVLNSLPSRYNEDKVFHNFQQNSKYTESIGFYKRNLIYDIIDRHKFNLSNQDITQILNNYFFMILPNTYNMININFMDYNSAINSFWNLFFIYFIIPYYITCIIIILAIIIRIYFLKKTLISFLLFTNKKYFKKVLSNLKYFIPDLNEERKETEVNKFVQSEENNFISFSKEVQNKANNEKKIKEKATKKKTVAEEKLEKHSSTNKINKERIGLSSNKNTNSNKSNNINIKDLSPREDINDEMEERLNVCYDEVPFNLFFLSKIKFNFLFSFLTLITISIVYLVTYVVLIASMGQLNKDNNITSIYKPNERSFYFTNYLLISKYIIFNNPHLKCSNSNDNLIKSLDSTLDLCLIYSYLDSKLTEIELLLDSDNSNIFSISDSFCSVISNFTLYSHYFYYNQSIFNNCDNDYKDIQFKSLNDQIKTIHYFLKGIISLTENDKLISLENISKIQKYSYLSSEYISPCFLFLLNQYNDDLYNSEEKIESDEITFLIIFLLIQIAIICLIITSFNKLETCNSNDSHILGFIDQNDDIINAAMLDFN